MGGRGGGREGQRKAKKGEKHEYSDGNTMQCYIISLLYDVKNAMHRQGTLLMNKDKHRFIHKFCWREKTLVNRSRNGIKKCSAAVLGTQFQWLSTFLKGNNL